MRGSERRNLYLEQKRKSRLRVLAVLGLLLAVLSAVGFHMMPREQPSQKALLYSDRFAEIKKYRESLHSVVHRIKPGDTVYEILVNRGVQTHEIGDLIANSKFQADFQRLREGERLELFFSRDSKRLEKVRYQEADGHILTLTRVAQRWVTSRHNKPLVVTFAFARGKIRDSLYQSAIDEGIDFELAMELADIFAWDIDFFVDLRPEDDYRFMYEQRHRDGK